jgi:hypothetical protein
MTIRKRKLPCIVGVDDFLKRPHLNFSTLYFNSSHMASQIHAFNRGLICQEILRLAICKSSELFATTKKQYKTVIVVILVVVGLPFDNLSRDFLRVQPLESRHTL